MHLECLKMRRRQRWSASGRPDGIVRMLRGVALGSLLLVACASQIVEQPIANAPGPGPVSTSTSGDGLEAEYLKHTRIVPDRCYLELAKQEFGCPSERLRVVELEDGRLVVGCGKQAPYGAILAYTNSGCKCRARRLGPVIESRDQ